MNLTSWLSRFLSGPGPDCMLSKYTYTDYWRSSKVLLPSNGKGFRRMLLSIFGVQYGFGKHISLAGGQELRVKGLDMVAPLNNRRAVKICKTWSFVWDEHVALAQNPLKAYYQSFCSDHRSKLCRSLSLGSSCIYWRKDNYMMRIFVTKLTATIMRADEYHSARVFEVRLQVLLWNSSAEIQNYTPPLMADSCRPSTLKTKDLSWPKVITCQ